jgi:sirohydrochlorin ferrochelatase
LESANEAVRKVAAEMARAGGFEHVEAAFLELGKPDLEGAVEALVGRGVERIVVIPYFLTWGLHMERDISRLVQEISKRHNGLRVSMTAPLDGHPGLVAALVDRAREAD